MPIGDGTQHVHVNDDATVEILTEYDSPDTLAPSSVTVTRGTNFTYHEGHDGMPGWSFWIEPPQNSNDSKDDNND